MRNSSYDSTVLGSTLFMTKIYILSWKNVVGMYLYISRRESSDQISAFSTKVICSLLILKIPDWGPALGPIPWLIRLILPLVVLACPTGTSSDPTTPLFMQFSVYGLGKSGWWRKPFGPPAATWDIWRRLLVLGFSHWFHNSSPSYCTFDPAPC